MRNQNIPFFNKRNILAIIWGILTFIILYTVKPIIVFPDIYITLLLKTIFLLIISLVSIKFHQKIIKYEYFNSLSS